MEIRHFLFDRITLAPEKCFGKPCVRGLRMPVASILGYLSSGMTVEEVLAEWPELEREDIQQALGYAACPWPPAARRGVRVPARRGRRPRARSGRGDRAGGARERRGHPLARPGL